MSHSGRAPLPQATHIINMPFKTKIINVYQTMSIKSVYFFMNLASLTGSWAPMGLVRSLILSAFSTSYSSLSFIMNGNTGYLSFHQSFFICHYMLLCKKSMYVVILGEVIKRTPGKSVEMHEVLEIADQSFLPFFSD